MGNLEESTDTLHLLHTHIFTRWVGFGFLVMAGWFLLSFFVGDIYAWLPMGLGRETSFMLGCMTLGCLPLALGLALLYTVLFAVGIGNVLQTISER